MSLSIQIRLIWSGLWWKRSFDLIFCDLFAGRIWKKKKKKTARNEPLSFNLLIHNSRFQDTRDSLFIKSLRAAAWNDTFHEHTRTQCITSSHANDSLPSVICQIVFCQFTLDLWLTCNSDFIVERRSEWLFVCFEKEREKKNEERERGRDKRIAVSVPLFSGWFAWRYWQWEEGYRSCGERVCSAPVVRGGCNLARKNTVNSTATGPVCLVQKRRSNMTFRVHGAPPVLDHGPAFNPSPRFGIATDFLSAFHPRDDIVARRLIFIYAGINIPLKIAGRRKWKYLI